MFIFLMPLALLVPASYGNFWIPADSLFARCRARIKTVASSRRERRRWRVFSLFGGGNPKKRKRWVGSPEAERAAMAADGPGTGMTIIPASTATLMSR